MTSWFAIFDSVKYGFLASGAHTFAITKAWKMDKWMTTFRGRGEMTGGSYAGKQGLNDFFLSLRLNETAS